MSAEKPTRPNYTPMFSLPRAGISEISRAFAQDFLLLNPKHRKLVTAIMEMLREEQRSSLKDESHEESKTASTA